MENKKHPRGIKRTFQDLQDNDGLQIHKSGFGSNNWNDPKVQQILKNQLEKSRKGNEPKSEGEERFQQGRDQGLTQGICIAIAHLLREGYYTVAKDIWRGAGMSIKECELLEVDEYDLKVIKKNRKEL